MISVYASQATWWWEASRIRLGEPAERAVASLPVVEDLQSRIGRVGQLHAVVHRLRSSSSVGIRPQNASMTALSASPIVSSARSPVGTPAVEHHDGGRDTRRPSSRRVGAFRLGSMLLALHQAGDRFVNDPDGTAGSSRKAPVARDGRRFTGGPRGTCGATDIFAAWRPWVRVWSTRCLCVGAHSSGGVP